MKLLLGLFVVVAVILLIVWKFGISGFDPAEQAASLQANVKPGMGWQQVLEHHKPGKFRAKVLDDTGFISAGLPTKFNRDYVETNLKNSNLSDGFIFEYFFSNEHAYRVHFDGEGKVSSPVQKEVTISDLLAP